MDDMKRTSEYRRMLPFIAKASNDVGEDTQGQDVQALILALNTHKSSADHDSRYYTESEITTFLSGKADKTLTFTAGNGLTGGGDLSANRTFAVGAGTGITVNADDVAINLAANLTWTGSHTFTQYLSTNAIYPSTSDIYDLGDYNKLWRKIWGSELSAVVFSEYTQVLLGGWFTVSKGEGTLPASITTATTQVDLGSNNFVTNDIIVFRGISSNGSPQVEYMKVGTLVSGTTYNVTRNLDGTGANNWPEGTVYGNWGQAGNGRVELNAYDTPRMSVYSHGAAIADFKEQVRIGDLSGNWGYASVNKPSTYGAAIYGVNTYGKESYGAAFGSYEVGQANITIDPLNGIRLRNYNTNALQLNGSTALFGTFEAGKPNILIDASNIIIRNFDTEIIKLSGTEASFENFITLGANGGIRQGTGTWGSSFTGTAMWNESGVMNVGGWNAGVKQWWGGSDGNFYGGDGQIIISDYGIKMLGDASNVGINSRSAIKYYAPDGELCGLITGYSNNENTSQTLDIHCKNLLIFAAGNTNSQITLWSQEGASYSNLSVRPTGITYTASGGHTFTGPITITSLAGSGNRPVYANAAGQLYC